jgi:23S rRNA (cytidine1920-2'-O)/16S rRNA (cytidine1409-2'-O)-methyltransferase
LADKIQKVRIDQLLVERGIVDSREKAKRLIMAGQVLVNGEVVDKPGKTVRKDADIVLKEHEKYVGRGGYKIESAWEVFKFNVEGKVVCDIGASTGGFTDFLLQKGAKRVYAVDVGRGQIHWKLRNDPRVVVMEKVNARYLKPEDLGEKVDFVTCDVSFISVKKIIPSIKKILKKSGRALILVKPQFEAGKKEVKKGVVRNKSVHERVIRDIIKKLNEEGFSVFGVTFSKVRGTKGNIEYFVYAGLEKESDHVDIEGAIESAWFFFKMEGI